MKILRTTYLYLWIFVISYSVGFANPIEDVSGEIININHQFRVAFTDLGKDSLDVGDIVEVKTTEGRTVYLEVIETLSVLSKLAPVRSGQMKTDLSDFARITVSNVVVRSDESALLEMESEDAYEAYQERPKKRRKKASVVSDYDRIDYERKIQVDDQFDQLDNKFNELTSRYRELQNDNFKLKEQIRKTKSSRQNKTNIISGLKEINKDSKKEIGRLMMSIDIYEDERKDYQSQIQRLKNTINNLKQKLQILSDLVEKSLNAHEK